MIRKKFKKINKKNTITKLMLIVFFCIVIFSFSLFNLYSKKTTKEATVLVNQKIDKILYQFFNELITDDIINKNNISNILEINKNKKDEILSVNYDLEKTYKILTDVSKIIQNGLQDLENGKIDVSIYDKYLKNGKEGLVLNVPLFLSSKNIFLNNLGPRIPVLINFNETLLTNIKTKVTNYGFNNALLEIYIIVEMRKLIITPMEKDEEIFNYDILIGALVINGSVPEFYGGNYEANSNVLDIPLN